MALITEFFSRNFWYLTSYLQFEIFCFQYTQLHTAKNAVYYHHQLSLQEDQGIDMTQVSGRDYFQEF